MAEYPRSTATNLSGDMSTPRFGTFSVFFPMWNEEEYLHRALAAASEVGDELVACGMVGDYELIVVDDASTDATPCASAIDSLRACSRRRPMRSSNELTAASSSDT